MIGLESLFGSVITDMLLQDTMIVARRINTFRAIIGVKLRTIEVAP